MAYWIPTYAEMGIEGVSIGSNDLTQLVLGVDRDSEVCAELFDEADPAVLTTPLPASSALAKRPASAPRSAAGAV